MENNELKKAGGDIIKINWPDSVLINSEYLIGSLTPDPSGKTCEGANNALKEIVENSIDVIYENPDATTLLVDTENFNGYNAVFDNSWGIPIRMSEVPGVTMARLSISELNAGSKFNGTGQSQGALIGRFGVGSSCTCALSKDYILLSKITNDNYNSSIPAVRELWEKSKTKKNLYYVVRYIDHGQLDFDGAMTLKQISKLVGVDIPEGFSTLVFFKLGEKYVPDPRVSIPYEDLEYFLLIAKEFYNRKVSVIANGKKLTAADLSSKYQFRIRKDIIPEDTSKNKVVNLIVYFDVDSELNKKSYFGCMNGLACTGTHINFVENAFEGAIRSYYGITHKYTTNWLKLCVIALAENVGFDTQYKQKVKSIGKVKQSDFSDALIKEFIKIFKKNPEIWDEYANKLNELAASMKALSASEKIQKMIENSQGRSIFKSKADLIPGFSDATGKDRWNCEILLCEGLSPAGSLKSGRPDTSKYAVCPLRGKIRSVLDDTVEEALENREIKTIFSVIGLGMADNNVTVGAKSDEEAYERIKKYSRYGKIIIAVDSDPDGADIEKLLLYLFGKFGQFLIKFGLLYRVVAPIIQQTINGVTYNYYPDDPIDPNTGLPVGVDPRYEIAYRKGLGSYQSKDLYDIFYGPKRRLIKITPEGLDYSMKLTEDINERKKLMIEAGVFTNPYNLPNVFNI